MVEFQETRTKEIFGEKKTDNTILYYSLMIITVLVLFLFIILANYKNSIYNFPFYKYEYEKNGIYTKFDKAIVDNATINLFLYLNNNQENITSQFFSERDKLHLIDVKHLIKLSKIVYAIVLILFLLSLFALFYFYKHKFKKSFAKILIIASLLYIIIFIAIAVNQTNETFQKKFIDIHYTLFDNDYWILDPEKDNLINLFPQQFWYDIVEKILKDTLLYAIFLLIIGVNIFIYVYLKNKFFTAKNKSNSIH
ncbi:TIGR01906 family membrane protein [Candidatus Woesearchaeota archaeon]|nr:TIGR01906 family membrane protein [Candidatus Woesearchaeota archaeon]